uniref:phage tail protein n=1 Tax=Bacillus sp. 03113 TaxID=2578211 RepID=UPI0011420979|nr:phage tail protein [Bacillus sp. 03113]
MINILEVITRNREIEPLSNYKDLVLKGGVNQYGPLSFFIPKTEMNQFGFNLIQNEEFIGYEGHQYRIKKMDERLIKNTPVKIITEARHRFYDIIDTRRESVLSTGLKSINELLSFIFTGTRWTFSIIDAFGNLEFENFGNDNCLALFNKVIERFEAEFEIIGNEIRIRNQIGSFIDMQFRHNHNIKTFKKNIDTSNLSTRIKGTGKRNQDGTPIVSAEYVSPNASFYMDEDGNIEYKDAPPYSNETITNNYTLIEHLAANIQDEPDVFFDLEFIVLQDAGYTKPVPERGDVVPTILEELGVDVDLRIMEIELYPESKKSPRVALANYKKTFAKSFLSYQKSLLNKIYDENKGKLRYDVYEESVQRATEALNNSLTELEYPPGMGILARDPNDPNKFVVLRSTGIGVTTDGGVTFPNAITAEGINTALLIAGQIKTNNIQIIGDDDLFYWDGNELIAINAADSNKYVKLNSDGLYIAKGAMIIERPDGYKVVNDGILQNAFGIQGSEPPFQTEGVEKDGQFYRVHTTNRDNIQRYTFKHDCRYLHVVVNMKTENGMLGTLVFDLTDENDEIVVSSTYFTETRWDAEQGYRKEALIDLGTPTGNLRAIYWRMYGENSTDYGYGSVRYIGKEG